MSCVPKEKELEKNPPRPIIVERVMRRRGGDILEVMDILDLV
jgi:hypothetical protein